MPYIGNSPANNVRGRFYYTASAAQTLFSGADSNGKTLAYQDGGYVDVYLNGVLLQDTIDYTATTKTSITLVSGATAGDLVEIVAYGIFSVADTVSALSGGTFNNSIDVVGTVTSDGLTVDGNVSIDGGTIKLDGNYPVGTANVALGDAALDSNVSGGSNTAIGADALTASTTASYNTVVGYLAGSSITTANNNTLVGGVAGWNLTTGSTNTFVGAAAGQCSGGLVTTGSKNTILGPYDGNQGGLDIRTSSNNIVLSDGDGNPRLIITADGTTLINTTTAAVGNDGFRLLPSGSGSGQFAEFMNDGGGVALRCSRGGSDGAVQQFARGSVVVGSISVTASSTSYNTSSDYRLKENVVELTGATDRLKQIPVHRFNFIADAETTVDGFLAHEVQAVVPEAITGTKDEVDADGNPVYQGIDQSKLVPLLVATIKELEARIAALETP